MAKTVPSPPKPRSEEINPNKTRLPILTRPRLLFRRFVRMVVHVLIKCFTRTTVNGYGNIPATGPYLIVSNHLGDADAAVALAKLPFQAEALAKAELYKIPLLGWAMDAYGVIWVHRGQPDRRALRVALKALKEGRIIGIAPEGRESLTGALEAGTGGAAYIAVKANVPLLPITFTGTENKRVYRNMLKFKRTEITMRIGETFMLEDYGNWKEDVNRGTEKIMYTLAKQLPLEYRGPYQGANTTEVEN